MSLLGINPEARRDLHRFQIVSCSNEGSFEA